MRLMLDTHVAIWAIIDDARLSAKARTLIASPANAVVASVAAIWEIAIKQILGRAANDMPVSGRDALDFFRRAGFEILPVLAEHAVAAAELPLHHGDPFDRLLVAQATVEKLRLVTADRRVAAYGGGIIQI